jgi:hypothetical protein
MSDARVEGSPHREEGTAPRGVAFSLPLGENTPVFRLEEHLPGAPSARNTSGIEQSDGDRMPRTIEEISRDHYPSATLKGLVGVLDEKLQMRTRYALLEYEATTEQRPECSELWRALSRAESRQIELLGAALTLQLQQDLLDSQ